MKHRKIMILSVLVGSVFCLAAIPAWAGGRINQGASGLGTGTSCADALTAGTPWVIPTISELNIGNGFTSCTPFNGTITTMWDLFDVSATGGDDITLVVNDPSKNWGVFDEAALAFSGDSTCGDPLGGVTFSNCVDSADGTVFENASTSGDIVFYTDPGALQYISETDPTTGNVTLLYGEISTTPIPEPSSVWLLLGIVAITAVTLYKRRRIASRLHGR